MSKIVVLDAGHGGDKPGAVNGKRYEKDDVLRLAFALRDLLTSQGILVYLTRLNDSDIPLAERCKLANSLGADLFVSLHRNSHTDSSANGVEVLVQPEAGLLEQAAAAAVLEQITAVGIQRNRGIKRADFQVLRSTWMPAMMVELGFISNNKDNQLFDQHFEDYAQAIALGICNVLGEKLETELEKPLFRVQIGAFQDETNARRFLAQVREQGLEAFLIGG